MKAKKLTTILAFILLALALAVSASAENLTYIYTAFDDSIITQGSTNAENPHNVTLPNTTWDLELINNDSKFTISLEDLNHTDYPILNITARHINLSNQSYDGSVGRDGNLFRYLVDYGYAFIIDQWTDLPYTVTFDSSVLAPRVLKCTFDLSNETADVSSCIMIGSAYSGSSTNFSAFFIAEDHCANSIQDYLETGTDCGSVCPACPTDTGIGGTGGGGGGGGAFGGPDILYVTPTIVGASVQVYQGNELIVQHGGEDYHFRVVSVKAGVVQIKSLATYATYDINLGDIKTLGLTSSTGQSVTVEMFVSDHFGLLTFKIVERPGFSFDLLPPGSVSRASPTGEVTGGLPTVPQAPAPPIAPTEPRVPQELELPESPIDIWTILASILFVIFLVGGVALYRVRLHRLEKPPTVTRTGLETDGLPETSSEVSRPAPTLRQLMEEKAKRTPPPEPEPVRLERPKTLSKQKELEVQKYVFHAFSSGFTEAQVRQALIDTGWPAEIVDWVLQQARAS